MMNYVLLKSGSPPANFRGFMADEASANWQAIQTFFNNGPSNRREISCLFFWKQSFNLHTIQCVSKNFQDKHKCLCKMWRGAFNEEEAIAMFRKIRGWWAIGKVVDSIYHRWIVG